MSGAQGFEQAWLAKFSTCLDKVAGKAIRTKVMKGSEGLSSDSSRQEVIAWTREAMERFDALVEEQERRLIMTGCACQYPKTGLREIRARYEATKDIGVAHQMLQAQFESLLRDTLKLEEELVEEIVERGWGSAGVRKGKTIIATKIPKSGHLVEYLKETDPERKRQIYCHCPRVREALKSAETISPTYCYCGAGFYRGIWEEILQQPVDVGVLETVLLGDEVCKVEIYLPPGL